MEESKWVCTVVINARFLLLTAKACMVLPRGHGKSNDVEHLGRLTMNLMQGYEKKSGAIGLDDPSAWSLEAITFLSDTTSAASVQELANVSLGIGQCVLKLKTTARALHEGGRGRGDAGRALPRNAQVNRPF